jgi:hypothetical protein
VSAVLKHLSQEEAARMLDRADDELRGAILHAIPQEDATAIIGGIMQFMDDAKLHETLRWGKGVPGGLHMLDAHADPETTSLPQGSSVLEGLLQRLLHAKQSFSRIQSQGCGLAPPPLAHAGRGSYVPAS